MIWWTQGWKKLCLCQVLIFRINKKFSCKIKYFNSKLSSHCKEKNIWSSVSKSKFERHFCERISCQNSTLRSKYLRWQVILHPNEVKQSTFSALCSRRSTPTNLCSAENKDADRVLRVSAYSIAKKRVKKTKTDCS